MNAITVVLAADARKRALCRAALAFETDIHVVGDAQSGLETLAAVSEARPAVLLLDLSPSRLDLLLYLPRIQLESPGTRILLLLRRTAETLVFEALRRGARGYLDEAAIEGSLAKAIRAVHAGEVWVPRRMFARIVKRLTRAAHRADSPGRAPTASMPRLRVVTPLGARRPS